MRHGIALGLLYGVAQLLQTFGLAQTSASVSGFITGLYVVATPLLGALNSADPDLAAASGWLSRWRRLVWGSSR